MARLPDLGDVRFLFDEDARGFGLWVSRLREDAACIGSPPVDELLPLGILDPMWIPVAGDRGWTVITRNRHIRTQPEEAALAVKHRLRVACLMPPKRDATRWDFTRQLLRHWDAVDELAAAAGPAWLSIYADRVRHGEFQPGRAERARSGQL